MATFALSVLPTARGRRDLLQHLMNTGADHIVLVDLAGEAGWTAMKQARQWILAQSTEEDPLHITAPCPHDGECPRLNMIEPCAFNQRIQRPRFTRKTKHAKRGEEDVSYSYLIVSRGERPEGPNGLAEGVGRFGAVGREAAARALAKATGRTEIREVEGSDGGEMEVVEIAHDITLPPNEDPVETEAALKAEAYSWPRLVAPPLKRSGFVVMDACMPDEKLMRFTVAKSLGKQSYYDARKSGWGDLWPHAFKGAVERKRGIRRLMEPLAADMALPIEQQDAEWLEAQAEEDEPRFAVDPDMDRIIKELAKDALVEVDADDAPATVYSSSSDYVPEAAPAKRRKEPKTEAAKKRAEQKEKREAARERKGKLRNARADKAELAAADRFFYRDADTATVRAFEEDHPEAEPLRSRDEMEPDIQNMSSALGRQRRRGPGFPFNTYGRELHTSARGLHTSARALSVAPGATGSAQKSARAKVTVASLQAQHDASDPITMLTAYDFPTSLLCSRAGVDIILVGDSMAQVCLGYDSTIPLTLNDVVHHTRAVARGVGSSFLLADMPFGYVAGSLEAGVNAAVRMVKEGGADGIKIEGGREILPLVERLTAFGVPVMPHIGLQPQRAGVTGYRAQGRKATAAVEMVQLARDMEAAGAFALLLEAVPHHVGTALASSVSIPTIGIGAGPNTSGQVLVLTDVLGSLDVGPEEGGEDVPPKMAKFVRQFGEIGRLARAAVDEYVKEVKARSYPAVPKETYGMPKEELEEFRRLMGEEKKE
jgi:3-methyl-2-oxobutanoate hydroxymethyltransferase